MDPKTNCDWENADLRRAAVELAMEMVGVPPVARSRYAHYRGRLADVAAMLRLTGVDGVPGAGDLLAWCRNPEYSPNGSYAGEIGMAESEDAEAREIEMARAAGVCEIVNGGTVGAVPNAEPDPLAVLLSKENDVLSEDERAEIARALDNGDGLTRPQRLAVACLLRGTGFQDRRDVIRATLDFLCPEGAGIDRLWEVRRDCFKVPEGGRWGTEPVAARVPGYPALGRQRLVFRDAGGRVVRVALYAVSDQVEGDIVRYRQLVPVRAFNSQAFSIRAVLLKSWVTESRKEQGVWAQLFNVTKAAISFHEKGLKGKVETATGGRAAWRGPRQKPQRNKGKKLKS